MSAGKQRGARIEALEQRLLLELHGQRVTALGHALLEAHQLPQLHLGRGRGRAKVQNEGA